VHVEVSPGDTLGNYRVTYEREVTMESQSNKLVAEGGSMEKSNNKDPPTGM